MLMRKIVIVLLFFTISLVSFSQKNVDFTKENFPDSLALQNAVDNIGQGDLFFLSNTPNYEAARSKYEEALKLNSNNAALNLKIAKCFYYTYRYKKSIAFFEKAYALDPHVSKDVNYFLGQVYQLDFQFEKAIEQYKTYQAGLSNYDKLQLGDDAHKKIKECETAKAMVNNPVRVEIENVGSTINTSFHDHSPVISIDGTKLFFTSKREGASGNTLDFDNQYCEDIYKATYNGAEWIDVENLGKPINDKGNNASVSITLDGSKLIICSEGDIYYSTFSGKGWSKPEAFADVINTKHHESTACLSFDGNYLYFVSDKIYDSKGGTDIYYSRKGIDGSWSDPENLGSTINTPYNEDFVFMHPDGKTMFFGSQGHNSMGGYDVFKSTKQKDGSWSVPENLGYPLNSPADEVAFVMTANGQEGYMASTRAGGYGYSDIYKVTFLPPEPPQMIEDSVVEEPESIMVSTQLTIVKGQVFDTTGKKPAPLQAELEVVDNATGEIIAKVLTNDEGKYLLSLPSGKDYGIAVKKDGYLFTSDNFNIPESSNYQEIERNVFLLKMEKDNTIVLKNVFFEYGKSSLMSQSFKELDRLIQILNDNPKMIIEIGGHTDNQSSRDFNLKLSEARAKSVVDYLSKDIDSTRLEYKGYAFDAPVADNDTEEGRAKNRRVEFKIISTK